MGAGHLSLAGSALAAGPKVPKALCLNSGLQTLSLAIKMAGTVNKASGPVKFYSINGEFNDDVNWSQPVVGSGHLHGTVFHFSLVGTFRSNITGEMQTHLMEAEWDLANPSAQLIRIRRILDAVETNTNQSFSIADCDAGDLPY